MSVSFDVIDNLNYVLVVYNGEFSHEGSHTAADKVLEAVEQFQRTKAMLDIREMTGELSLMDRFDAVEYGQIFVGKVKKFAMLARPDMIFPNKFVETIAQNRGINLNVFSDFDEAEKWLIE